MRAPLTGLILLLVLTGCGARSPVATPTPEPLATPTPTLAMATPTQGPANMESQPSPTEAPQPAAPGETESPAAVSTLRVSVFLANARACPNLDCEVVLLLEEDTQVSVGQVTTGQEVDGSDVWYEVNVEGQTEPLYLHSSVVEPLQ